jgi:hypothetical protein
VTIQVGANSTSYTDSGLSAETTYTYSISACNSEGCTPAGQTAFETTPEAPPPATAEFVRVDTETKGSWIGLYGMEGYEIINFKQAPTYGTVTLSGSYGMHTWSASTTDLRALQTPDGKSRFAACYYSGTAEGSSFTVNLNFTDNKTHRVSLYCVDFDQKKRDQRIQIFDANHGNEILNTEQVLRSFTGGQYLTWNITGSVIIKFTHIAPIDGQDNAVLSGIFFDDPNYEPPTPPAAPTGLTATAVSSSQINLAWTDNSSGNAGFKIERSTSASSGFTLIHTVAAGVTTYQNTGLSRNTWYYYRVCATEDGVDSAYSNTASARTPAR